MSDLAAYYFRFILLSMDKIINLENELPKLLLFNGFAIVTSIGFNCHIYVSAYSFRGPVLPVAVSTDIYIYWYKISHITKKKCCAVSLPSLDVSGNMFEGINYKKYIISIIIGKAWRATATLELSRANTCSFGKYWWADEVKENQVLLDKDVGKLWAFDRRWSLYQWESIANHKDHAAAAWRPDSCSWSQIRVVIDGYI